MSLKDSLELIRLVRPRAGTAALDHEILAEKASSLGAAERRVRECLDGLGSSTGEARGEWLGAARHAVWAYFVQRELCGFRRHNDVIRDLSIPAEVLNGLGMVTVRRKR